MVSKFKIVSLKLIGSLYLLMCGYSSAFGSECDYNFNPSQYLESNNEVSSMIKGLGIIDDMDKKYLEDMVQYLPPVNNKNFKTYLKKGYTFDTNHGFNMDCEGICGFKYFQDSLKTVVITKHLDGSYYQDDIIKAIESKFAFKSYFQREYSSTNIGVKIGQLLTSNKTYLKYNKNGRFFQISIYISGLRDSDTQNHTIIEYRISETTEDVNEFKKCNEMDQKMKNKGKKLKL